MRKQKYWAGFCDGRITRTNERYGSCDEILSIYVRKKDAQKYYSAEDVRPVEIKEIKKRK